MFANKNTKIILRYFDKKYSIYRQSDIATKYKITRSTNILSIYHQSMRNNETLKIVKKNRNQIKTYPLKLRILLLSIKILWRKSIRLDLGRE